MASSRSRPGASRPTSRTRSRRAQSIRPWSLASRSGGPTAGEPIALLSLLLFLDRAFMPVTQQQTRQEIEHKIDDNAGHREQEQRREQTGDRESVARLEDAEGEPGLGAAGAGHEFGDNGANQGEPAADPQPREKIRERRR